MAEKEKKAENKAKKNAGPKKGFFARIGKFFTDLKGETKKVVWPTRKQAFKNTGVVLVFVLVAAVVIGGFDLVLGALRTLLLSN